MKFFLNVIMCFFSLQSYSQSLIDSIGNPGFALQDTIEERLAELAINNALTKVDDAEVKTMYYDIKKNKATWLNSFNASFNLNEANINPPPTTTGQNLFFPRYNFSLTVPLGSFFTRARDVQIAKSRYEKAIATKDLNVESLKTAIKIQYQKFITNKYLLALHELILQDEKIRLAEVEDKFRNSEISLEIFTIASKRYNDELVKKIILLRDMNTSKLELENLLGMTLEAAMESISRK